MTESVAATLAGDVIDRYMEVWNEPDTGTRGRAVAALWTEDGTYTDPLAVARGYEEIEAVIAGAREQFPGHVFGLIGDIDAHHDLVRFGWGLSPKGGHEPVVVGFDVAVIEEGGRLRAVYGFLDKVPTA